MGKSRLGDCGHQLDISKHLDNFILYIGILKPGFARQVKERRMGELFSNFEAYDVQATRREAEGKIKNS